MNRLDKKLVDKQLRDKIVKSKEMEIAELEELKNDLQQKLKQVS